MRQFVVLAHDAPTEPGFSLDDLPGAGRLDVLCRCVTAGLLCSHGIRTDTRVWIVLDDALSVRFEGGSIKRLNPDERSTAALFEGALEDREEAIGHIDAEASPGVFVSRRGFSAVLDATREAVPDPTLLTLHENGTPVRDLEVPNDPVFVLSDDQDFTENERSRLAERSDDQVRLGPEKLHANHAITIAHNYLDTGGFERY